MANSEELEISVTPKGQLKAVQEMLEKMHSDLQDLKKNLQPKEPQKLLSKKETAGLFNITLSTLDRWSDQGILQRYSIGNRIYYKRTEAEAAMKKL